MANRTLRVVTDLANRTWIIDPDSKERWELTGPGQIEAAQALYGPRTVGANLDVRLGWQDRGQYFEYVQNQFGIPGPRLLEKIIAGQVKDPLTGEFVQNPRAFEDQQGNVYAPEGPGAGPAPESNESSKEWMREVLAQYGLEGLVDTAWDLLKEARTPQQVEFAIRDTKQFKERFPAMDKRVDNGYAPITPGEYVQWEARAKQIMESAGLPKGFYDQKSDFTQFIENEVTPERLQWRVAQGFEKVSGAPREVRDAFRSYFGEFGDNALAAFFLDPKRAEADLARIVSQAEVGGAALQQGFNVSKKTASRIARLGYGFEESREGFAQINKMSHLFRETLNERQDLTATGTGVEATFDQDPLALERLRKRGESRVAEFEGGGGAASTREGIVGLGSAN